MSTDHISRTKSRLVISALSKVVPWLITVVALYIAFKDVDWSTLLTHLGDADPLLLVAAFGCTCVSYLMRSRRWQYLFSEWVMPFGASLRVLILGFFMNNVLPARAGEFVRAHMGGKVAGTTRTLVLASIASERLADGLMLSIMFVVFAVGMGGQHISHNLLYVAALFGTATVVVLFALLIRSHLFSIAEKINDKINHKASHYALDRFKVFVNGLAPLCSPAKLPGIILWTVAVWGIELLVYILIADGFDANLTLASCVLFLVTVNFSSLVPSAPGAIGVIEVFASAVLVSVGVPREKALTMVLTQHVMQYLVVGIPGSVLMLTWRSTIKQIQEARNAGESEQ